MESPFVGVDEISKVSEAADTYLRENTRLGIPALQIAECLHGQLAFGATIFPQAISQGSTWNPELIQQMAEIIAEYQETERAFLVRHEKRMQDLVFIGLSANGDSVLTSKFIKSGANDFLSKPFYHEEFYCRIMQNLESQEMIQTIRNSANLDPLTKVYNRRFLYEKAEELFANKASRKDVIVSMIDADNFKSVNDTYGHKTGDMLLQEFAALLKDYFPDDLIVRYGGEEFAVILPFTNLDGALTCAEKIRKDIAKESCFVDSIKLELTVSVGLVTVASSDVGSRQYDYDGVIKKADEALYQAKEEGRNRVCIYKEISELEEL